MPDNLTVWWFNESSSSSQDYSSYDDDDDYWNYYPPFEFPTTVRILFYILYNTVFLLGLMGNILTYYTIHHTHPRMKTVQNHFLSNLALGDLLILLLCVPFAYINFLWQYWPFGSVLCRISSYFQGVGVFVSSYTLVALACDRYRAILSPLKPGLTRKQARITIVFIWGAALITSIPVGINTQIEVHLETGLSRCGEYGWPSEAFELAYNITILMLQYCIPIMFLIYTYIRISIVVWGRKMHLTHSPPPSKKKTKTVILSLSVVLGYTLAWLPHNTLYMLYQHGPEWILDSDPFPYLFLVSHFLAMSHTTFNPFIYFWINSRFRGAFTYVLCSKVPCLIPCLEKVFEEDRRKFSSWRQSSIYDPRLMRPFSIIRTDSNAGQQRGSFSANFKKNSLIPSPLSLNSTS